MFANASAIATMILTSTTVAISGSLTATSIYTKTEVDNLLTPKAATTYVYAQLLSKANQATTYTKTEVDTIAATRKSTDHVSNQSNS